MPPLSRFVPSPKGDATAGLAKPAPGWHRPSSLSDLKNRSENLAGRGQILTILQGNSRSIAQKSGEIWTGQANLQPISFESDRLLE
jgi:hypothetical protein